MNKLPERIRIKDIARLADVSVGTVDRVLHGRTGVSEASRKRVEEILKQLDYQPNMYASALASNKKYLFVCLLPQHKEGDYWTDVELGMKRAVETFSDFHITLSVMYYDQYEYSSFINAGEEILKQEPDGVLLAPTIPEMTARFTDKLQEREIPYIYRLQRGQPEPAGILRAEIRPKRILCRPHGHDVGRMSQRNRYLQTNQRRPPGIKPAGKP